MTGNDVTTMACLIVGAYQRKANLQTLLLLNQVVMQPIMKKKTKQNILRDIVLTSPLIFNPW